MTDYEVKEINNDNISSLIPLQKEAVLDNTKLVDRMIDNWKSRENTFSKQGEKAWGLFIGEECIGFAGINIDPYLQGNDGSVGRVRHVYVAQKYRGQGLSKVLMSLVLTHAKKHFKVLRLATKNPIAMHLYESLGFKRTRELTPSGAPMYTFIF